jgi:hypothetical protein
VKAETVNGLLKNKIFNFIEATRAPMPEATTMDQINVDKAPVVPKAIAN